jgi:hypothetical protein
VDVAEAANQILSLDLAHIEQVVVVAEGVTMQVAKMVV